MRQFHYISLSNSTVNAPGAGRRHFTYNLKYVHTNFLPANFRRELAKIFENGPLGAELWLESMKIMNFIGMLRNS